MFKGHLYESDMELFESVEITLTVPLTMLLMYQVANFWCSVDILLKLKNRLDISQLGVICLITTFIARYIRIYL